MNNVKLASFCVALALSASTQAQTLTEAVDLTIANNPNLKAKFFNSENAENLADAAYSAYLPSVDVSTSIGQEYIKNTNDDKSSETAKRMSVTARQLIWDGSNTIYNIKRTGQEADAANNRYEDDVNETVYSVVQVYLDVLRFTEIFKLSDENLQKHNELYISVKRRSDTGLSSTSDLYQAELRLASAQNDKLTATNNLKDAQVRFMRLVGEQPIDLIEPEFDENFLPDTLEEALYSAINSNKALISSNASINAARYEHKQSMSSYYPTFTVEASHSYQEDAAGNLGDSKESSVMLNMRWNLFNGGGDMNRAEAAASSLREAQSLRDENYQAIVEDVETTWNAIEISQNQHEIMLSIVENANKTASSYERQYQLNRRTLLDLLNTQSELYRSQTNSLDAKYKVMVSKYRMTRIADGILEAVGLN